MNSFFVRRYVIAGIFITIILVLLAKLFYIQVIDKEYSIYATKNVLHKVKVYPARGPILDRNGKILVENVPSYDIMVTPKEVKPFDTTEFLKLLNIDKDEFNKRMQKAIKYSRTLASPFEKQISIQTFASLQERLSEFQGFSFVTRYLRTYPDSTAAQFLGYIGEVNDREIKQSNGRYQPGDYIGITGVERSYEDVLRGQVGVKTQVVDSHGVSRGSYANGAFDTTAVAGARLISSLDVRIQKLGEHLMKGKVGSIVAIEPSTGEILCFVSSPTYDPNLMVGRDRGNNAAKMMFEDPFDPLLIRPIQAYYPPGSSFKPLSALIALQNNMITPQTSYDCRGVYWAGNHPVPCFHHEVHGIVTLSSAVAQSCNGYFSMVFERIINSKGGKNTATTFDEWRARVAKFGLGSRLGLDLPSEGRGNLPTAESYDKIYHKGGWRSSTVVSLAIGQGELLATPLQLANIDCAIANKGFYYTPHLIKGIGDKEVIKPEYKVRHYVGIDSAYFDPLIDGMQAVVDRGTAKASKIPGITMCGKTGTAQIRNTANSVFVAFAPRENPKIAVAVVVENGGEGGKWAAPIASFIVEKYLRDSISTRESGITVDYFANANLMPDPEQYLGTHKYRQFLKLDSIHKAYMDSLRRNKPIKTAGKKKKADNKVAYLNTVSAKRRRNE
ncbi:MAG: penicillin-binding protein 2 [Mucilaginibacter sp.]